MRKGVLFFALCLSLVSAGCRDQNGRKAEEQDTPTSGKVNLASDESFKPLVEAQTAVFENQYPRAEIETSYKPEDEAIQDLVEGRVRMAVATRRLSLAESTAFAQQKIRPRYLKFAEDGVGLIIHPSNPDSLITIPQLERLFSGKVKKWSELGRGGSSEDIVIVFDNNRSSNLNYILHRFNLSDINHLKVFAAKSNAEVLEYVKTDRNALGVIGVNWISDSDDPAQQKFRNDIQVVSIARTDNPDPDDYYQPYQAYLQLKLYPLRRDVFILSREARSGLATGFMSQVASQRGQTIVLKSGLLPATLPVRLVGIRDSF